MITFTSIEYDLKEDPEKVMSRLKWAVEEVETSWLNLSNWSSAKTDTNKPWVGSIDKRNLTFSIEASNQLFQKRLNVVIDGEVIYRASTTNVRIRLGMNNFSILFLILIYAGTGLFLSDAIFDENFNSYFSLGMWVLVYPTLGTFLIRKRLKYAERKLDELFG